MTRFTSTHRTAALLTGGFGLLILLILFQGLSARNVMRKIHIEASEAQALFRETSIGLARVEANVYESGLLWRDYLIRPDSSTAEELREKLMALRAESDEELRSLELEPEQGQRWELAALRKKLDDYWQSLDPILVATNVRDARTILQTRGIPKRLAVVEMTRDMDHSNTAALERERERLDLAQENYARSFAGTMAGTLVLALGIALLGISRMVHLETKSVEQRSQVERAERELRRLSLELVRAQEEERRALSRELHDEIGQKLTAIRLEIGRLGRLRERNQEGFAPQLEATKTLVEATMRAVRDLAMGLRPSMLDDLGLGPALGWQAREFSRHTGVPAKVECPKDLPVLPDAIATCLFRLVQEALTNCARHAEASAVRIGLSCEGASAVLKVEDDGVGFDTSEAPARGLGLLGMQERVRELGGSLDVASRLCIGTRLTVRLPLEVHG